MLWGHVRYDYYRTSSRDFIFHLIPHYIIRPHCPPQHHAKNDLRRHHAGNHLFEHKPEMEKWNKIRYLWHWKTWSVSFSFRSSCTVISSRNHPAPKPLPSWLTQILRGIPTSTVSKRKVSFIPWNKYNSIYQQVCSRFHERNSDVKRRIKLAGVPRRYKRIFERVVFKNNTKLNWAQSSVSAFKDPRTQSVCSMWYGQSITIAAVFQMINRRNVKWDSRIRISSLIRDSTPKI